ncbi:Scr1 family TA system antitoxin-like transcriptional regulator [Streptomyces sp. LBL]|uniref:Scr1 family TA system antitoxin-like transcriptional regulator n=1 Tax=Streptomyces sp. LBL TaxID=2940562 RepID=UPI0024766EF4|nr:Scr1 family TA system antitoxin-like transcriptional regulator [Streptomyces sp. LBL]
MSDSLKTFGEVVKAFRKRAGLTQEVFAPRVQYSVPTVASIEQGRRWRTGGDEVTREMYDHLLDLIERHWNVEFQLMPLQQPVHAGLDGPLQLAETPDNRWFGYSEGQENGRLITASKEISRLHQRYAKMRSQAMTPEDSLGLLKRMRGAL